MSAPTLGFYITICLAPDFMCTRRISENSLTSCARAGFLKIRRIYPYISKLPQKNRLFLDTKAW